MKRLTSIATAAALALAVFVPAAALAQPYGPPPGPPPGYGHPPGYGPGYGHPPGYGPGYGHPPGYGPPEAGWRHWHAGDRFDGPRDVVGNWGYYHLPPPPYGYQWVRYPNQYVLLGVNTGVIAQVIVP
jgi:hypothetical protein